MKRGLAFDDVSLIPQYSDRESRRDPNCISLKHTFGSELNKITLDIPIISANMDTVTGPEMCEAMSISGGLGVLHRYYTSLEDHLKDIREAYLKIISAGSNDYLAVSVHAHTQKKSLEPFLEALQLLDDDFHDTVIPKLILCLDLAHGHHKLSKDTCEVIWKSMPGVTIMAGNVATYEGCKFLVEECGVSLVKAGISSGHACSTFIQTGFGVPQLTCIEECTRVSSEFGLISDGGIKTSGDISKALGAGADAVMTGRLLAGTVEAPGKIIKDVKGMKFKEYRGSASRECKLSSGSEDRNVEGVSMLVPYNGTTVKEVLENLTDGLKSSLSYGGSANIKEFQENAQFMEITHHGYVGGTPFGLNG
jgi:IMP dehydrogenase